MLRPVAGVLAGIVAAVAVVILVQTVVPPLLPTAIVDPADYPRALDEPALPAGATLTMIVGWLLGAGTGGAVAGLIGRSPLAGLPVGFVLALVAPILFGVASGLWIAALVALPAAGWLGGWVPRVVLGGTS